MIERKYLRSVNPGDVLLVPDRQFLERELKKRHVVVVVVVVVAVVYLKDKNNGGGGEIYTASVSILLTFSLQK